MASGWENLGDLMRLLNRGQPPEPRVQQASRVGEFAMMPQGGLMGGQWNTQVQPAMPPVPQQMPPDERATQEAIAPYVELGGWGPGQPPPIPEQMTPEVRAWLMRQQNPYLSSRIDGSNRSPAGF